MKGNPKIVLSTPEVIEVVEEVVEVFVNEPMTVVKKALHEPKHRVRLPPRPPKKVRNVPKIEIPPFKTKPWVPPQWIGAPTQPVKENLKNKPLIKYPPLKMRKTPWNPNEIQVPVRKLPKTYSSTFYPSVHSKLGRVWNKFKILGPKFMILRGTIAQDAKKYKLTSNNKQVRSLSFFNGFLFYEFSSRVLRSA